MPFGSGLLDSYVKAARVNVQGKDPALGDVARPARERGKRR
jgi:hypothetical protein